MTVKPHGSQAIRRPLLCLFVIATLVAGVTAPGSAALTVWARQYNGPANTSDEARAMAISPLGTTVFVAGGSWGTPANGYDYVTVAYDSLNGNELWTARYDGPIHSMDQARAMGVSPSGNRVYVTGEVVTGFTSGGYPLTDAGTIAYDAITGKQLWVALYDGPEHSAEEAVALAVGPEGRRVYVSGFSYGHAIVVAYDARTGKRLWAMRYQEGTTGSSFAGALAADAAGRVYAAGYDDGVLGYSDLLAIALDGKTGALLWEARHHGEVLASYDRATAIAVDPAGSRAFVTGGDLAPGDQLGPDADMVTIAYDASSGAQKWVSHAPEPGSEGRALVASPDGLSVYATGTFGSFVVGGGQNYGTVAYDAATGIAKWIREYDGGIGRDEPTAIAVAPTGGRVYVTGESDGFQTGSDYATVVYNAASGLQLAVRRYAAPGLDRPTAIGVHPLLPGVYVTGWVGTAEVDGGYNYGTVGYVDVP